MAETMTRSGTLQSGMRIGDDVHYEYEMREALTSDLFAAEEIASPTQPLRFNAALMTLQLTRVGTFEGPFTVDMIGRLKADDYGILRATQLEMEDSGEAE